MSRDSDTFLRNVRAGLAKWKQEQLKNSVEEEQDTMRLNLYLKQTAIAYEMLKSYLDTQNDHNVDASLQEILTLIGRPSDLTREEEMLLREYLLRDLVEYPFTYNTSLINSFRNTNVFNTKIVPNK